MSFVSSLSQTGVHETAIRKLFKGAVQYDGPPIYPHPLYCIGFFNRSGSNLLASYLRNTPFFSGFHEHLNLDEVSLYAEKLQAATFPELIQGMTAHFGNGKFVHGFKASVDQLMMLERFGIPRMYEGGMRIIHITRDDLVGQAVSYQIAIQTKQWTSRMTRVMPDSKVDFDANQLSQMIDSIQESANGIAMFAQIFNYPRLHLTYEDLLAKPEQILKKVARFAGQRNANWPLKEPELAQQASDVNARFHALYMEHLRGRIL